MKREAFLLKAKHNEEACKALKGTGEFNDWVITTAYYAAIYYVIYEMFPSQHEFKGKPVKCNDFDDYYQRIPHPKESKHSVREDLVNELMPEVYTAFSTLKELCFTARYKIYNITDDEVQIALESLAEISAVCSPLEISKKQPVEQVKKASSIKTES